MKDGIGALFYLAFLCFYAYLGTKAFDYMLWAIVGKDIPWYGDFICGVLLGWGSIPIAGVLWILNAFGAIHSPLL